MPRLGRCGLLVLLAVGATVIPAGVTQAAGPPPVRTTGTAAMTTNGCSPEASSCTATLDQASWTPNPAQPGQPVTFHARFFIEQHRPGNPGDPSPCQQSGGAVDESTVWEVGRLT